MRVKNATDRQVGPWTVRLTHDEVLIAPDQVREIEAFANDRYLPVARTQYGRDYSPNLAMRLAGIPSPVIRFDMPPAQDGFAGVYEAEANTSGLGIAELMGVPVGKAAARALNALGISEIGWGSAPSREAQHEDHSIFMRSLAEHGIRTHHVSDPLSDEHGELPLWLRAGDEDMEANGIAAVMHRCLLLHYDGGGHKGYLTEVDEARELHSFASPADVFETFPNGFCLKPKRSWGTMNTFFWLPSQRSGSITRTKMAGMIAEALAGDREWIAQAMRLPRRCDEHYNWIWRLILAWDGDGYKVVGGFESGRSGTLRIHGASDAVYATLRPQEVACAL